ncbi:hypothetical protein FX988_02495 [Paraglaciecola mesophila]|uniref:YitT family protein n=1 Tax=Paraglaciecola mesophila TaxID=197222 RepID=A0A857JNV4_9ALTE|nr:YitT family protein [Paraglaciecola mesophila]QHJ12244.1 hypothetical protein FX988_02495 [Paraglaciecola mesophila]
MHSSTHRFYEDVLAILSGTVFVGLGLAIFKTLGLLIGGTAGIALLLSQFVPIKFGLLFFLVNLPFYYIALKQLGWRFTLNTFVTISLVSVLVENMHLFISLSDIQPVFGAVVGGMLIGMGMLILFRHKSSLGGLGILAFYLQGSRGIRAGTFQLVVDSLIVVGALFVMNPILLAISLAGMVTTNVILAVNHKPGRYHSNYAETMAELTSETAQEAKTIQQIQTAKVSNQPANS